MRNTQQPKLTTISGKPKIKFKCNKCGFTNKTSGLPIQCPACHFDPRPEPIKEWLL